MKCEIKNYKTLKKQLQKMQNAPKKVINRTLSDFRERVPGWVETEVKKKYNIEDGLTQKRAKMRIEGKSTEDIRITYRGTKMTATHFDMEPISPPSGNGSYTLKAKILKGRKSVLGRYKSLPMTKKRKKALVKNFTRDGVRNSNHSPIMLQKTGAKDAGKVQYIPFQRKAAGERTLYKSTTISIPEMINAQRVRPNIDKTISEKMGKRIENHMKLLKK